MNKLFTSWQRVKQQWPSQRSTVWYHGLYWLLEIALALTLVSFISFLLIDKTILPLPWSWLVLWYKGWYAPVIAALLCTISLLVLIKLTLNTGIYRWYALRFIKGLLVIMASAWLGLIIFKCWSGLTTSFQPWQIPELIMELKVTSYLYHQLMVSLAIGMSMGGLLVLYLRLNQYDKNKTVLGDSRFARPNDMQKAGLFKKEGIVVGKAYGQPLKASGFEHVLAFAPTGSGKTTSIAIPNLLTWLDTCVVNDPKFELFRTTSQYREQQLDNAIYLWAPTKEQTNRYNPLQFISACPHKRIGEIQQIGYVIIPNGHGEPIWYQSSRELFLALVLYLLDTPDKKATLPEIYNLSKKRKFNEWLEKIVQETTHYDPEFYRNASSYLNTAEKTRASILKTFTGYLEIFADPIINAATSDSDFDLRDLRRKKMTIYIGFSDNEKERLSPLLTIFWQQLIAFMTVELTPDEKYPVLCVMEEFSVLGRLVNLKNSLKILRGYRVRALIIIQYLAQIKEYYSAAEAEAFDNIKTKLCFSVDSVKDADYISKELGYQTKTIKHKSVSKNQAGSSVSTSFQQQSVPLMRPEQLRRLKKNEVIIMRTGHAPVMAKKCWWFKERALKHLPCGQVNIPYQKPIIMPFDHQDTPSKAKAGQQQDAEASYAKQLEEKLAYQRELAKLKVQASAIASALQAAKEKD